MKPMYKTLSMRKSLQQTIERIRPALIQLLKPRLWIASTLLTLVCATSTKAQVAVLTTSDLKLTPTVSNTCSGGGIGSVTLTPTGGVAPYVFDYLKEAFTAKIAPPSI